MDNVKEKKAIAIVASLGFGIRNFIMGKFVDYLKQNYDIHLFSNLFDNDEFLNFAKKKDINVHPLLSPKINSIWKRVKSIRDGLHVAYVNNETWKLKRSEVHHHAPFLNKIKSNTIMLILKIIKSQKTLEYFDKLETKYALKSSEAKYYYDIFKEIKPSLIFSVCPLVPDEWLPIQVGRSLGIKTALYILSWDNLSTKQRPPLPVDLIFVWNKNMEDELKKWYPGSEKAEISITSSTQFDFYFDPDYLLSREEFFRRFNLDPSRPLIVYSGVTPSLMPEENFIVERLIEDLRGGKIIKNPQLLIRLHPKDDGKRYFEIKNKYKDVVFSIPGLKNEGDIKKWTPDYEEIKDLVNIVKHCDVLINVASTMTVDAALMDKPVVNVRYYLSKNESKPPWGIYIYETTHYKPLISTNGFRIADNPEKLVELLNLYLENPHLDKDGRERIVKMICGYPDGKAYEKIGNKIINMIN